jgi:hypothetical protein
VLADGADPHSSPALAARAERLVGVRSRDVLAKGLTHAPSGRGDDPAAADRRSGPLPCAHSDEELLVVVDEIRAAL